MDHPFTSLKILGVLDHKARTAVELAKMLKIGQKTVLNHTAKLLRWDQIEVVDERVAPIPTGILRRDGKVVITHIRTRVFKTTARGRARLERKGDHKQMCPQCYDKKGR